MKRVGIIIVIAAVVLGLKFWNRGEDNRKVKAEAKALLAELPMYAENSTYLDGLFERHHTAAFDAAYDMGGRRRGATFNEDRYLEKLFSEMARSCFSERKKELGEALQAIAKELTDSAASGAGGS